MGIGNRIKEARLNLGYTQEELAKLLGVTKGAVANYEIETSHPKEPIMYKLIEVLNVDANYLFQDCVKLPKEVNDVTLAEYEHIKKYRNLDDSGRQRIDYELDKETERVEEIRQQKQYIERLRMETSSELIPSRIISYCQRLASAGSGEYLFDDIPTDVIKVKDTPESRKADFVIGVNGSSMEPDYSDGEKVFVEKSSDIEIGEVGVFVRGNECFIKECGTDGLISKNPKYADVEPFSEGIKVVGKVIGKALEI